MGNQVELLKPFTGKPKSVKTFVLWRDEDSLMQRQVRARGIIGTYRKEERLHISNAQAHEAWQPERIRRRLHDGAHHHPTHEVDVVFKLAAE